VMPGKVGQVIEEQPPQPGPQLALRFAVELREVALGLQESQLDQVRGPALGSQVRVEFLLGNAEQVAPARLQRLSQRLTGTGQGLRQPLRSVFRVLRHASNPLTPK